MKITDIKTYPTLIGPGNQLIIKVETNKGIHGWGASGLSGRELAVIGAIQHYREFLIGKDPRQIGAIWQETYRSQYFEGGRVLTAAISAIDIALHDIKGKFLGVPVYELLGGKMRDYVDCFASVRYSSQEELIERCRKLVDNGWMVLRLYCGFEKTEIFNARQSTIETAKWLVNLRKELGCEPIIGIDYHHRLTIPQTVSFVQQMPKGTIDFIEEPIRDESPEAYENLRLMTNVPFALGEEFASKWQFLPYIERGITQFARVDVCNVGGITEAMKVAAMAEAHYIDLMPHNPLGPICTAASIHLAAACTNFSWLEEINTPAETIGNNSKEFYPVQPQLDGSRYVVSDMPGLGVEFNEKLAEQQTFQMKELPHLKRTDGAFTNW